MMGKIRMNRREKKEEKKENRGVIEKERRARYTLGKDREEI